VKNRLCRPMVKRRSSVAGKNGGKWRKGLEERRSGKKKKNKSDEQKREEKKVCRNRIPEKGKGIIVRGGGYLGAMTWE